MTSGFKDAGTVVGAEDAHISPLLRFWPSFIYLPHISRSQLRCVSLREAPTSDPRLTDSPLPLSSLPCDACLSNGLWSAVSSETINSPGRLRDTSVFVLNSNIWCLSHDRCSRYLLPGWPESSSSVQFYCWRWFPSLFL